MPYRLIVLDTHAWLWWASSPEKLSPAAREAIDQAERMGVASISCWEVATLADAGRIELDRPVGAWVEQALALTRVGSLPLSTDIAVMATLLGRDGMHGDPADRIIYSTAVAHNAPLITRDARLREFDPRRTLW